MVKQPFFRNLNYTFENTCIYGLVGRNGAGKTTLLNILSNYDKNYYGSNFYRRRKNEQGLIILICRSPMQWINQVFLMS